MMYSTVDLNCTCTRCVSNMCGSRKYPYHPKDGHWKFRGGGGSQKPTFVKESMRLNCKIPGGGGFKPKNLLWGRYGYIL